MDINEFMAESNERARSGRQGARSMILSAVMIISAAGFLWVAAPNFTGGAMGSNPAPWHLLVPALGIFGIVVGLVWMLRIYRADPEPDAKAWRYRR